jgi:hypothetical protein
MPPSNVHFNGSVNLPDAETVMRELSSRIPSGIRRVPDGETGERGYWIVFQVKKLAAMPEFETVSTDVFMETKEEAPTVPHLRLAPGVSADSIRWPDLGYADAYSASFDVFKQLQADGIIPAGVRFQMEYPTPVAPVGSTFVPEDVPAMTAAYESALFADLDRALATLPHDAIAVQWDIAVEFGLLEGAFGPDSRIPLEYVAPGVARCIDRVPADVPVGLHLCYGDYGHEHFLEPESLATQVQLINAVTSAAARPLNFVAFTVPQGRSDEAYFAPLSQLQTGPDTELNFGIVPYHPADQAAAATGQQISEIDAALAASPAGAREWGISTECGMGRVNADDVPGLLDLHREILERFTALPLPANSSGLPATTVRKRC